MHRRHGLVGIVVRRARLGAPSMCILALSAAVASAMITLFTIRLFEDQAD